MAKRFLTPINLPSRSTDPATASEGDLYFNTVLDTIKLYYNSEWNLISGENVSVSDTPPASSSEGQLWYESDTGNLFIYYDGVWVQTGGGSGGGGTSLPDQIDQSGKFLSTNGDVASWNSVTKTTVGLSNVENTALSTWAGSSNITTLGTVTGGTWQGTEVSTTYTAAKVTSVNGSGGAITGLATLSSPTFTGTVTLAQNPTQALQAATKQYVDEVAEGLKIKPAVEIATTANLSSTYDNGVGGVGATLTASSNGAFPAIDGVTLSSTTPGSNGVLVKNQSTPAQNGRYNLTQVGNGSTPWILTRCGLCDESSEIPGMYVFIKRGTSGTGSGWVAVVANSSTFVIGTDAINYTQFSSAGTYSAGTGLDLTGTVFSNTGVLSLNGSTGAITGIATIASPTFTGTPAAPTASAGTSTTQLATTAFVTTADNLKASLSGATFTGSIIAPAATTSISSIRLPHGTAPTSPTNGDVWTTTAGLFARVNNGTVGPYGIGTARTFYQTTEPSSPATGDIWIDSDEVVDALNSNDFILKSGGTFTGTVLAPTAAVNTNTTQIATTAFVNAEIANDALGKSGLQVITQAAGSTINTAGVVNTLQILQGTAGADAFMTFQVSGDYAAHFGIDGTTNDLSYGGWSAGTNKYRVWHAGNQGTLFTSPALTGTPTAPTATAGTNTTQLATTAFVTAADNLKANLASPNFTTDIEVTTESLSGTASTVLTPLAINSNSGNADYLRFKLSRESTGTNWLTAGWKIQRTVDVSDMGYIEFGSTGAQDVRIGSNVTDIAVFDTTGTTFSGTVTGVSPTAAGSTGFRKTTMSTAAPTGGLDGDVWLQYA